MRTFPNYRLVQEFQVNKKPKIPFSPPWGLLNRGATCEIQLSHFGDERMSDKFSFEQIRSLATDIIEDCQPPRGAGVGGWSEIGNQKGWVVKVRGVQKIEVSGVDKNVTRMVEEGEGGDVASLPLGVGSKYAGNALAVGTS
ncbi:MAG: hypothetical protein Q9164_007187 [Protoblastenia rupestris]